MQVVEDIILETKKNLNVSVGNVIAGSKEEIKKQKKRENNKKWYWNKKNKDPKKFSEYRSKKYQKNIITTKKYYRKNRKKIQKRIYKYITNRRKNDLNFRTADVLRRRMRHALKGALKKESALKLLGCTMSELWQHLESKFQPGMTRENYGQWHIDHIKPCASFDLTKDEEQAACFHYTNLQPLWAEQNLKKGKKYENRKATSARV